LKTADLVYTYSIVAPIVTLIVLYLMYGLGAGSWDVSKIWEGYDGQASTSKFQFFLWTIVIFIAYVSILAGKVANCASAGFNDIPAIPRNVLTALGLSIVTAATAKGITSSYIASGKMSKSGGGIKNGLAGILQDDTGAPDLSKIQLVGWTVISIVIYAAAVYYKVLYIGLSAAKDLGSFGLPDIDPSLMVLMGLGQGAYLGKKLVTTSTPRLTGVSPSSVPIPTAASTPAVVAINGTGLGATQGGNQILLDGVPFHGIPALWTDSSVQLSWPISPAAGTTWTAGQVVNLAVLVNGQSSNAVPIILTGQNMEAYAPTRVANVKPGQQAPAVNAEPQQQIIEG